MFKFVCDCLDKKQRSFYVRMLNVANEPERSYETIHIVGYTKNKLSANQQTPITPPLAGTLALQSWLFSSLQFKSRN